MSASDSVFVEAPARLHFGVLDLRGDLGRRFGGVGAAAPLLARLPLPSEWRCVVVVPRGKPGLTGEEEAAALARLPAPAARDVERVAHLVLMQLLPAIAEADLPTFGVALAEVQRITGGWFAPAQGGVFAPGQTGEMVERLRDWGAAGVGQSSWGPAVYGITASAQESQAIAARARAVLGAGGGGAAGGGGSGGGFSAHGARVRRGAPPVSP